MTFILSKLLLFLIKPIVWVITLLICSVLGKSLKYKKYTLRSALLLTLFFTNTWILNLIVKPYEVNFPLSKNYDYGILLGGFSNVDMNGRIIFNVSSDRILQSIKLYRNGTIKKIILSGGNADLFKNKPKEADLAADYLREIGIPDSAIVVENQSRNTKENLINSEKLIQHNEKLLVISSAWHLPRVELIAKKLKLNNIDFYPTNPIYKWDMGWEDYLIPNIETMNKWDLLLKEWVGYFAIWIGIQ